ncbi:hypothetical protein BURCENBC7_AP6214 [Burkholderia cenocepacia BC7]|nr:uncharacterized protein BCN122_I1035 [Burkholderia cenocepacia]EPZ87106.1 hypothetical protein BURCENK562V_C2001 [Burkholderia cenocepacia K56-2Valvano]ERI29931.1 hypothetical protein BURCENBC7_AP6214 [Burkholderia cenocepacia BC7]CDN59697.1 hypothetical protein I35_1174 [Burkholderia cenocepacia H111]
MARARRWPSALIRRYADRQGGRENRAAARRAGRQGAARVRSDGHID